MNSLEKRKSVMKDYDLIANQYFEEFGTVLEDIELINKFESYLPIKASIIDLGGGAGKITNYFIEKGYKSICYDFSENIKNVPKSIILIFLLYWMISLILKIILMKIR